MFSKSCEYGLRATIFIAEQSSSNQVVGLKTIAKAINSPEAFTAKILQVLTKNNIISSIKGPHGGFRIEESRMKEIKLIQIITILDGNKIFYGCGLGLDQCDENFPCPLHNQFVKVKEELRMMFETNTLQDILFTENVKNMFWLKR
ncbi:RrF2 family transcriptional regulator [Algoriphagus antarcticus]|uniref:BadM/Rrf2 family transcriptional regulator n=1 Tax=Algoriphagus antarcticus TaxID=238540 RepID=A0A3E0DF38_9BACT|nr:Rrf2 family transcriptional regulator [Algoriphagus antarcticus]REG81244.1 BadM/Rrf2 family transcriptional regulator [Algoriphagus antarcticus]